MTTQQSLVVREVEWFDPDAVALRDAMTAEVAPRYADRAASMPLPKEMAVDPADLVHTAVAYRDGVAVGHVALRRLGDDVELKRMYVEPALRGTGVSRALLSAAEAAAVAHGARRLILQTGDRQPEAAALYLRAGWTRIPLFPPYLTLPYSLCFEKVLVPDE